MLGLFTQPSAPLPFCTHRPHFVLILHTIFRWKLVDQDVDYDKVGADEGGNGLPRGHRAIWSYDKNLRDQFRSGMADHYEG